MRRAFLRGEAIGPPSVKKVYRNFIRTWHLTGADHPVTGVPGFAAEVPGLLMGAAAWPELRRRGK
jgi:hypothetical protein